MTKWSKLRTPWRGVSLDTLLARAQTSAEYALARSYGGYTTNLPLADLLDGQAWVAYEYDGEPLAAEHGGPARLLVPAPVPVEVGQVGAGHRPAGQGRARVLGEPRLPQLRRPMARAAVLGRLTWQVGTVAEIREETATARTLALDVPGWPGHAAGQHVDVRLTAEDGYSTQRSYSIASAARPATGSS